MFQILPLNKIRQLADKTGFIFLEILIAVAIISIVFIILLSIGFSSINMSSSIKNQTKADFLAKEELEALRSFRDGTTWETNGLGTVNFTTSNDNNSYYLFLDSNDGTPEWVLQTGSETVGIFTRYIVFNKVSRDPSTKYIQPTYNSSNDDPDTVGVKVTISWLDKVYRVFSYLTNWQNK